jgi:hypothetical protein
MTNSVIEAIKNGTSDPHVRAAMMMGAGLESSWNTDAVGDNGKSFGPFQIYTVAHPGVTRAQASDPVWAVKYMLPSYQAGVNKVTPSLWQSNPSLAAATAAFYAERPKVMYKSSAITAKWPTVAAALAGQAYDTPTSGGGAGGGVVQAVNPLSSDYVDIQINNFKVGIMKLVNFALFFAAIGVGALFLLAGLILLFRGGTAREALRAAGGHAGTVVFAPVKAARAGTRYFVGPAGERGYDNGGD